MAHIILKTSKPARQALPLDGQVSSGMQPMVIDFSSQRTKNLSPKILYVGFGFLASFVLTSLVALFIIGTQVNNLWRQAQQLPARYTTIHGQQAAQNDPAAAFPATTLTPLPSKAFIMGKDFQHARSAHQVDLVPMLERLPLNSQRPAPSSRQRGFVDVEPAQTPSQSSDLQQQADDALADGNTEKSIALYLKAIRINPDDETLRSNCVALLLQQARAFDENRETASAISAYRKAQILWRGDDQTSSAIKARIEFLENN